MWIEHGLKELEDGDKLNGLQSDLDFVYYTTAIMRDNGDVCSAAHSVFIRLVLGPYTVHFKSAGYMRESTLDLLDKKVCKETLSSTAQRATVREAIGNDSRFWAEFCALLRAAIPSLERRSFTIWDPSSVDYESTSGTLIASHYPGLWKDLERINDLLSIARNVLTAGAVIQDLAAAHRLDEEVSRLVNCCIRVTARGFDGDAGTGDEEKWQWIVNAYKKLLITSLQFLNNLVAQNERRKLMLWLYLFENPSEPPLSADDIPETSCASLTDVPSNPMSRPNFPLSNEDLLLAFGSNGTETLDLTGAVSLWDDDQFTKYPPPRAAVDGRTSLSGNGYALFVKRTKKTTVSDFHVEHSRDPTPAEIYLDSPRRWAEIGKDGQRSWQALYEDTVAKYKQDLAVFEAKSLARGQPPERSPSSPTDPQQPIQAKKQVAAIEQQSAENFRINSLQIHLMEPPTYGYENDNHRDEPDRTPPVDDMRMLFTARSGTKILESGKAELMKRLEGYGRRPSAERIPQSRSTENLHIRASTEAGNFAAEQSRDLGESPRRSASFDAYDAAPSRPAIPAHSGPAGEAVLDEDELDDDSEVDVEDDEDDEDYPGSTEDGRGLLTDVPLILGPSEIEVLPMLIMSSIVPSSEHLATLSAQEANALINMHTVRTHLLLSQSNGRNLLRELLIFVAAWDLREEELYFKFMVKIMEAILKNGLMPYAYHAFRDRSRSKDIISPAQAVIMKLLTCIFRARGETAKVAVAVNAQLKAAPSQSTNENQNRNAPRAILPNMPTRVDLHILNFIFTEFRQHIIPQTCALIFLQGQIHAGKASPEDFPLNLWDMERMYEGVYQYLEFFAVLTEESIWKGILGEWEMASELVTLLRELEGGIPKMGPIAPQMPRRVAQPSQRAQSADAAAQSRNITPVAVERPFDMEPPDHDPGFPPLPPGPPSHQIFEAETPLAYPEDPVLPLAHDLQHDHDEPSDFEWRNLKKLTVLVLSSLIWKNRTVQDQVRVYGGLEALVSCCKTDENNPYIREHAIMCLRFAVEGCEENARVIRRMAASQGSSITEGPYSGPAEDVPREVLDTNGYETFMDTKGQVGLRRKEGSQPPAQTTANTSIGVTTTAAGVSKPRLTASMLTAEKAAELMQNALRDLPLGDKFITDRQKAEALAKLDRAFESTDKIMGGNRGRRA